MSWFCGSAGGVSSLRTGQLSGSWLSSGHKVRVLHQPAQKDDSHDRFGCLEVEALFSAWCLSWARGRVRLLRCFVCKITLFPRGAQSLSLLIVVVSLGILVGRMLRNWVPGSGKRK